MTTPIELTDPGAVNDAIGLAAPLALAGRHALSRLGFEITEPAEVQIHVGVDDHPDHARITLTWPLPPEVRARLDEER